jgi:hypothetical protein
MTRRICLKAALGLALAGMLMGAQDAPKAKKTGAKKTGHS